MMNYLMITLKIIKASLPVCDVRNSKRAFRQSVKKDQSKTRYLKTLRSSKPEIPSLNLDW